MQTRTEISVRYPDCDRMGIVHHAVYPYWYEMARMDFLAAFGFSYTDMNKLGVNPAMVDMHIQYKGMATYPQSLYITTRMGEYAPKKIELLYETYTQDGVLINTARTFHIWTGPDNRSYDIEEHLPGVYELIREAAEDE